MIGIGEFDKDIHSICICTLENNKERCTKCGK